MIIPVFRVVTSQYPIESSTDIEPGQIVALDSNGYAVLAYDDSDSVAIGLAADRNRASEAYEWTNRVNYAGNDTAAAGMLSVYHGGGEFYVDLDDSTITTPGGTTITGAVTGSSFSYGDKLYIADAAASATHANAGQLENRSTGAANDTELAIVLETDAAVGTGIPGEYEPANVELADGTTTRKWIKIKLLI